MDNLEYWEKVRRAQTEPNPNEATVERYVWARQLTVLLLLPVIAIVAFIKGILAVVIVQRFWGHRDN